MLTTDILWQNASHIIAKHFNHPFSKSLAAGNLPLEAFKFYLQQDAIYIKQYAKAMTLLSQKAPNAEISDVFAKLALESYELEHIFQKDLFLKYNIEATEFMQPACLAYSSFLISTISTEKFLHGLTSLLPCFWLYLENGKNIAKHSVSGNPYQSWIDTYVSEDFIAQTNLVKRYVNDFSIDLSQTEFSKISQIFNYSCSLDYQFMDHAYYLKRWPNEG